MKKLYAGMTDSKMLGQAQVIQSLFEDHLDDFGAYDVALNEDFALALQAKIDEAYKHPADYAVKYGISSLVNDMKKAWKACSKHFREAKYFIEKAFPGNAALHNVFGFSDYYKMTRSYKRVRLFMDLFDDEVNKYKSELLAAGYKQQDIDAIATLTTNFNNAVFALHNAKKTRRSLAQIRTNLMNEVWRDIKTINVASKSIYRTDYARLKLYRMPAPAIKAQPVAA